MTKLLQGLRDELVRRDYAAQLRRYLDSGSSSCEHMTAENAETGSN